MAGLGQTLALTINANNMKFNEKQYKIHLKQITKIAKEMGLIPLANDMWSTKNGLSIDFSATQPDKLCMLAVIGQTVLLHQH